MRIRLKEKILFKGGGMKIKILQKRVNERGKMLRKRSCTFTNEYLFLLYEIRVKNHLFLKTVNTVLQKQILHNVYERDHFPHDFEYIIYKYTIMRNLCVLFKRIVDPYLSLTVILSHMTKFVTIRWRTVYLMEYPLVRNQQYRNHYLSQ